MKRKATEGWKENGIFSRFWLIGCAMILISAVTTSLIVYVQVSADFTRQMEKQLYWKAVFYREQLDQVFLRTALHLDSLVHSTAVTAGKRELIQDELFVMQHGLPSVIRSWVAYPNGVIIPAPNTRIAHIQKLAWWSAYLKGSKPKTFMGYLLGRSQALVGKPFVDQSGMTVLVPLISLNFDSLKIINAAGLEFDLNRALSDNTGVDVDWTNEPISIYSSTGQLLASPYLYNFANHRDQLVNLQSNNPLIEAMRLRPDQPYGYKFYTKKRKKMAGIFLRDPSLGLNIVVEQPAVEVINPVCWISIGPLINVMLCILIATLFIKTIYSSLQRLRKAEQLTQAAEVRALQAHINPHFLFNTLDRMVGFVYSSEKKALITMIRSLANIFRYTTRSNSIVFLREELDYLNEYLALQKIRYGSRFTYQLHVQENLLATRVIKFCTQPLVENCFVHGVEKSLDPIEIIISIFQSENALVITVSDDGPGITEERLKELNNILNNSSFKPTSENHGLGILNIHLRLLYSFGPPYGLSLASRNPGLIVRLRMPLQISNDFQIQ